LSGVTATAPNEATASAAVKTRDRIIKPPFCFFRRDPFNPLPDPRHAGTKNCKINAGLPQTRPKNDKTLSTEYLILIIELFSKRLFRVQ
jgi:hypothetical protein